MTRQGILRRVLLLAAPAALTSKFLAAQDAGLPHDSTAPTGPEDLRLPDGKKQRDAMLKADYEQNVKDAQNLAARAHDFERDLEKSDEYVLSLGLLKELDDIEKITRRIRGRMRRF